MHGRAGQRRPDHKYGFSAPSVGVVDNPSPLPHTPSLVDFPKVQYVESLDTPFGCLHQSFAKAYS